MNALLARPLVISDAAAVLHAVDSVSPYVRSRIRGNAHGLSQGDVLARVQDRLLRELHRFDPAKGTLPAFTQHLARWVVADVLSRPVREVCTGLDPRDPAGTASGDPLRLLIARDEQDRWTGYIAQFLTEADLGVLVQIAAGASPEELADRFGLTPDGLSRVRTRVGAVASTVRQAMQQAASSEPVTFQMAAACVANFQGARYALPVLHMLGAAGLCPLADPGGRRGPGAAARAQAAGTHAAQAGVTVRVATDRVQMACRLLRIALDVIAQERGVR